MIRINTLGRDRMVAGAVTSGYLFLALDTSLEHLGAIRTHWQAAIPPVVATVLFLVLSAAFLIWNPMTRRVGRLALWASAFVGLLGFYFHNAERLHSGIDWSVGLLLPPLLAPLAFVGQAAVGLLAFWETPPASTHPE